jgi:hypothetical protein
MEIDAQLWFAKIGKSKFVSSKMVMKSAFSKSSD